MKEGYRLLYIRQPTQARSSSRLPLDVHPTGIILQSAAKSRHTIASFLNVFYGVPLQSTATQQQKPFINTAVKPCWCHDIEMLSESLALCVGNHWPFVWGITGPLCGESLALCVGNHWPFVWGITGPLCGESLALCVGNPPVTGGFPSQWASAVELQCFFGCWPTQTVEQSVMLLVIWDAMMLMYCPCGAQNSKTLSSTLLWTCHMLPELGRNQISGARISPFSICLILPYGI